MLLSHNLPIVETVGTSMAILGIAVNPVNKGIVSSGSSSEDSSSESEEPLPSKK